MSDREFGGTFKPYFPSDDELFEVDEADHPVLDICCAQIKLGGASRRHLLEEADSQDSCS
jgi:hypothetical protein